MKYNFFRILQWFCLISKLGQTQFDGLWRCKDTSLTYSSLTVNLYFGPAYHLLKFGHVVFLHPVFSAYRDIILSNKSNNYFTQASLLSAGSTMFPVVPHHFWGPCVFVRCAAVICRFLPHLRKVLEIFTFGSQTCHITNVRGHAHTHTNTYTHTLLNAY